MQMNAYLSFDGRCEEAFKFYETCLNGKIVMMTRHRGSPMEKHVAPEWADKIMHARLVADGSVLMGSDGPPEHYRKPQGISVTINLKDPLEAERVFHALAEGGTIGMPIQKTFWAARFGMLVDRFGTPWMINCEEPAGS